MVRRSEKVLLSILLFFFTLFLSFRLERKSQSQLDETATHNGDEFKSKVSKSITTTSSSSHHPADDGIRTKSTYEGAKDSISTPTTSHDSDTTTTTKTTSTTATTATLIYLSDQPDDAPKHRLNYTLFPMTTQDDFTRSSSNTNDDDDDTNTITTTTSSSTIGQSSPLANCPITSQLRIRINENEKKNNHDDDDDQHQKQKQQKQQQQQWILETLDINGKPKSIGGDEFYITYHDETVAPTPLGGIIAPRAVAFIQDMEDGSYHLSFTSMPDVDMFHRQEAISSSSSSSSSSKREESNYIQIHLIYTCDMGMIPPPFKESWNNGGFILTTYTVHNVPIPIIEEYVPPPLPLLHPTPTSTTISDTSDTTMIHSSNTNHDEEEERLDLSSYDRVLLFGDSNMEYFCSHKLQLFDEHVKGILPHIEYPINNETVEKYMHAIKKRLWRYWNELETDVKSDDEKSIAIIMGSGTWDLLRETETILQGRTFQNHLDA